MADFNPRKSIFGFPVEKDTEIAGLRRKLDLCERDRNHLAAALKQEGTATGWVRAMEIMRECDDLRRQLDTLRAENERLQQWVSDCQAGMYINCVYCGHRYGPDDEVPASMADVLKEHVEQCPKHPMSALKADNERLREAAESASTAIVTITRECDIEPWAQLLGDALDELRAALEGEEKDGER